MPCVLLLLFLAGPRLVLALLFFFSNYITRAYHGILLPLIGFIFLPWTTLVYAWVINSHGHVEGLYLVALIIAVVVDLGAHGGGWRHSRG